ncbi:MAG: hypothetical protein GX660_29235, partial [Clostridiaceae bacterium]|nr:hypothetical protein [Clostridiaceae bacterium]
MSLELMNDTQKILNEVREISGKEVVFRENNSLRTYAIAKTARSGMKNHIIYYKPVHSGILNYIIAHECGHMIRIYKETKERLKLNSDNESMEKALYMVDKNCKVKYSDDIKRKIFPMWVNGIITQLTSIPEDIRIEKWIYGNFPEIREMQKSALERQSK